MSETLTISAAPPPDWATIDEEIRCPLCDYNLRGLPEPRCPECGYRFDWPGLLDPTRRKHPFVFEHHPERNLWSFYRTLRAGLRPARFWRSLHPAQPASLKRLIGYIVIVATFMLAANITDVIGTAVTMSARNQSFRTRFRRNLQGNQTRAAGLRAYVSANFSSIDEALEVMAPRTWTMRFARELVDRVEKDHPAAIVSAIYVMWPVLSLAALLIFRWSMRTAKVRTIHVFRCIAYAFDTTVWMAMAFLCAAVLWAARGISYNIRQELFYLQLFFVILSVAVMTYRLYVGYKVYLQFDRPLATAVASQVIVLLVAVNIGLYVTFGR